LGHLSEGPRFVGEIFGTPVQQSRSGGCGTVPVPMPCSVVGLIVVT
jgi:hypothetical protein